MMDLWRRLTNKGGERPGRILPDTSSRCVTESVSATHDFVVTNYSLLSDLDAGEYVSSGTFSVGGYEWVIRFYPGGYSTAHQSYPYYASAFLLISTGAATARYTLGFLNREGEALPVANGSAYTHTFRDSSRGWGFADFGRKSELRTSRYLHDDCLTIRCVLTVIAPRTEDTRTGPAAVPQAPDLQLHGHLERMLTDGKGTDVTFDVGGQPFRAHRCVLAARSPVFDAQLFGPMKEKDTERVEVGDMEPAIFELLLHFIYTDSLPGNGEGCSTAATQHLLVAADRYGLEKLKQMCDVKLRGSVDVETAATTLALAEQHHCPLLRDACVAFISSSPKVLADVVATDGFKHLMASCPVENLSGSFGKVSLVVRNQEKDVPR